jgi:hypothetical protein
MSKKQTDSKPNEAIKTLLKLSERPTIKPRKKISLLGSIEQALKKELALVHQRTKPSK